MVTLASEFSEVSTQVCMYECACEYSDTCGRVHTHKCAQAALTSGVVSQETATLVSEASSVLDLKLGDEGSLTGH